MGDPMSGQESYDCIVIGGGPAGSTVATLLAQYGHRVALFEQHRFPRHHIGESLMPETYWTFQRLGMLEKLRKTAFPLKESVQFVSAAGQESQPFYFWDRDPNEWSITWQVRRDEFDRMMLDNTREQGAEVHEGVRVKEVLFEDGRAIGIRTAMNRGPCQGPPSAAAGIPDNGEVEHGHAKRGHATQTTDVHANVVVDATGICGLLSKQLGLRYGDAQLKNAAVYAYFENAQRDKGRNAGATIIIHTLNRNGWFWFIPLPDEITSIGVVGPPSYLCTGRGDNPLATLEEEIADCPAMAGRLTNATRVSGAYVTSDFSYRSRQLAGEGWVMVGDAFCFLDPIYSSGVMLALKSGEWAADAIHDALEAGDCSAARLGAFGPRFVHGVQMIRQLVYAFYDKNFSFAAFTRAHPEYHDHLTRILIGDVFNGEVAKLFDVMKNWTALPDAIAVESANARVASE